MLQKVLETWDTYAAFYSISCDVSLTQISILSVRGRNESTAFGFIGSLKLY